MIHLAPFLGALGRRVVPAFTLHILELGLDGPAVPCCCWSSYCSSAGALCALAVARSGRLPVSHGCCPLDPLDVTQWRRVSSTGGCLQKLQRARGFSGGRATLEGDFDWLAGWLAGSCRVRQGVRRVWCWDRSVDCASDGPMVVDGRQLRRPCRDRTVIMRREVCWILTRAKLSFFAAGGGD